MVTSPFANLSELLQTTQEWSKWLSSLLVHEHFSGIFIALPFVLPLHCLSSPLWQFICFIRCFLSIISAGTNTTELSVIPWCFLSYQGGLEPAPQTLSRPCRAASQRGSSWRSEVSVLCVTLSSLSQLPCGVLCPHSQLQNVRSGPGGETLAYRTDSWKACVSEELKLKQQALILWMSDFLTLSSISSRAYVGWRINVYSECTVASGNKAQYGETQLPAFHFLPEWMFLGRWETLAESALLIKSIPLCCVTEGVQSQASRVLVIHCLSDKSTQNCIF